MKNYHLSLLVALLRHQLINWENKIAWSLRFVLFGVTSFLTTQIMGLLKQLPDNYLDIMTQIIFEPWGVFAVFIILSVAFQMLLYSVVSARLFKSLLNW